MNDQASIASQKIGIACTWVELELPEHSFHVLCLLPASERGTAAPSELSEMVGALIRSRPSRWC